MRTKTNHNTDRQLAGILAERLAKVRDGVSVLVENDQQEPLDLPAGEVELLREILQEMALGRKVAILPEDTDLTTQQVADILNVSRTYVVQLMKDGVLPYHMVGTHRRARLADILAYKMRRRGEQEKAMDELVKLSEDLDLYDLP